MATKFFLTMLALVGGLTIVTSKTIDQRIREAINSPEGYRLISTRPDGKKILKLELDVLVELDKFIAARKGNARRGKRKALSDLTSRWPNVPIQYKYTGIGAADIQIVENSIACWEQFTCLDFQRNDSVNSGDYILFQPGSGCSSYVGRIGGQQEINLAPGCFFKSVVIHEIGHAIGWVHEQSRPDRDTYVTIHSGEIESGKEHNFNINNNVDCLGVPYDYLSIMHYSDDAFAVGSNPTITTADPAFQDAIGTANQFSFLDIKLANLMYNCAQRNNCPTQTCPCGGYQASDCNCYCSGNPIVLCNETTNCENITTPTAPTTTTRTTTPAGPTTTTPTRPTTTTPTRPTTTTPARPTTTPPTTPVCNVTVTTTPCPQRRQADPCVDKAKNCARRAKKGACVSKRDQMLKACRKTCNFCDVASPPDKKPAASRPKKPNNAPRCRDTEDNCNILSRDNGCKAYKGRMINLCRKTCGFCRAANNPANRCLDRDPDCPSYASIGLCAQVGLVEAMKVECPKSCKACTTS